MGSFLVLATVQYKRGALGLKKKRFASLDLTGVRKLVKSVLGRAQVQAPSNACTSRSGLQHSTAVPVNRAFQSRQTPSSFGEARL